MEDLTFITLDFETDSTGNPLLAGQVIDDEFAALGITITTNIPDTKPAIIFDSSNPTGGDSDLGTPNGDFGGPGQGAGGEEGAPGENNQSLGNVLIIAKNVVDSDGDGLIDVPNDNNRGGEIFFNFAIPTTIHSLDLLDDDDSEMLIFEAYDVNGNLIQSVEAANLGENSLQTVLIEAEGVAQLKVISDGTFAIDNLKLSIPNASLGDKVFEDLNGNGIQDAGEQGVENVKVILTGGGADGVIGTGDDTMEMTFTDADGMYLFEGLNPGEEYKVTFDASTADPDFVFTTANQGGNDAIDSDADPTNGMTQIVTLASGENNLTLDAGLIKPAGLGDFVFEDDNGNGIQDAGESGVEGVLVKLQNPDGSAVLDGNGDPITTNTDANGGYSFTGLTPGEYKVMFVAPDGFDFTTPNAGSDDGLDSDADPINGGMTQTVVLESGDFNDTLDAGLIKPAGLGDFVFEDDNGNGIQDAGESGVEGVLVKLQNPDGSAVLDENGNPITTTTDANGGYSFTGLTPGEYKVMFVAPDGFDFTTPNAGSDDGLDSDADPTNGGMTQTVILESGDFNDTLDAGLVQPAGLGDFVFEDDNGNGIQDAGEAGVEGVLVKLQNPDGSAVLDENGNPITTTTDANGGYSFTGLTPGEYKVMFVAPDGFDFTTPNAGSDDGLDSDADPTNGGMTQTVILESGDFNDTLDAGLVQPASLGDRVFNDLNGNGIQDDGEPGVEGVKVILTGGGVDGVIGNDDDTMEMATTDANGLYSFEGLNPGEEYKVTFSEIPDGFIGFTDANQGGNDSLDSDADPSNGMTQIVTLQSGENNPTLDAGLIESDPSIDIEKFTNGLDADTPDAAAEVVEGETVVWTYKVTNDGNTSFTQDEITVTDDQEGLITNIIDQGDGDNILSPGEMWVYQQQGIAQNLSNTGDTHRLYLTGHSYFDGHNGNIRTFSAGDISVKTSAFSRSHYGNWSTAFLGAFSGGLGVTDSSEGNGGNGLHRVDNVYRDNFILFEFSEEVVVDRALLASVSGDSDITYWVGTDENPFTNHNTLSDSYLNSLELKEDNNGGYYSRWADINNGELQGNVLVIAASTSDTTPEDRFKLKAIDIQKVDSGIYKNVGTVQAQGLEDSDPSHYVSEAARPSIDIEKFTNGVDADTADTAVEIAAGESVTWTYNVTNDGNVSFTQSDITVTDDQEGTISNIIDQGDGDNILSPGEMWVYQQQGVAQNLTTTGATHRLYLTGNSYLDGHDGNTRTFSTGGITVEASAFSRSSHGNWSSAFLGAFSSGLGVTDSSEGNGGNGLHRVDNVYRDNFILFEFSEEVVVDRALLASVSGDSDITYWVGTDDAPLSNPNNLSDAYLNSLELQEDNNGGYYSRWADINASEITGNVLVIAASTSDTTPDDRFKLKALDIQKVESGIYQNTGTVQALGLEDSDLSHYVNSASSQNHHSGWGHSHSHCPY